MVRISFLGSCGLLLVCGLTFLHSRQAPAHTSQAVDSLAEVWADLASEDAIRAYRAIWQLAQHPEPALKVLRANMKPAEAPDLQKIETWIADLANPKFAIRDKAFKELEKQGELAEGSLKRALDNNPDLETRQRGQLLLDRLRSVIASPDKLRQFRAIEALEIIGNEEAKVLLKQFTQGFAGDRLTKEAQATLQRMEESRPAAAQGGPATNPGGAVNRDESLPKGAVRRIGTTLFRQEAHSSSHKVAFSDDGMVLAAAGTNNLLGRGQGAIYLWETRTGKLLGKKEYSASCLAFAPKGRILAIGQAGTKLQPGSIILWDAKQETELAKAFLPGDGSPEQLCFTHDGSQVVCKINDKQARKEELRIFDAKTLQETKHWTPDETGTFTAFTRDGVHVVVHPRQGNALIWNLQTGAKVPFHRFRSTTYEMVFSPDGALLAGSGPFDAGLRIWDVGTGKPLWIGVERGFHFHKPMLFSPDRKFFAAGLGQYGPIGIWSPESGEYLRDLPNSNTFGASAISPDSRFLAGSGGKTIRIWDLKTGQQIADGDGHSSAIEHITFLPSVNAIATSCDDGVFRIWDAGTGKLKQLVEASATRHMAAAAFTPNAKRVATSDLDDVVNVRDVTTGKLLYRLPGHGRLGSIRRPLHITSDGRYLMSFSQNDYFLRKWDLENGKAVIDQRILPTGMKVPDDDQRRDQFKLDSLISGPSDAIYSHKGDQLVLLSANGNVHFFDTATGKESRVIDFGGAKRLSGGHVALSPSNTHFAILSRGPQVTVYNQESGKSAFTVTFQGESGKAIFSPDGRTVAVVADKKVNFVEIASGKVRMTLDLHSHSDLLRFSADGRRFITAMDDTTAMVWDCAALAARQ